MIGGKRFSGTFLKGNDKLIINYFFILELVIFSFVEDVFHIVLSQ